MIAVAILFSTFVAGLAIGYFTRALISKKRRVRYLQQSPYQRATPLKRIQARQEVRFEPLREAS
jgi:hypothetical protein